MQINSIWLPALARASRLTVEQTRARLIGDPCYNVAAGRRSCGCMWCRSGAI
jgi:hypothetical protein